MAVSMGEGFPGWHLECTAMSTKYLGQEFDIHGGGTTKFRITNVKLHKPKLFMVRAQLAIGSCQYANLKREKMAKSTGNNILPNEIFTGENTMFSKVYTSSGSLYVVTTEAS